MFEQRQAFAPFNNFVQPMISHIAQIGNQIWIGVIAIGQAGAGQQRICRYIRYIAGAGTATIRIGIVFVDFVEFRLAIFPQMLDVHDFLQ